MHIREDKMDRTDFKDAFKIGDMLIPFDVLDSNEALQSIDLTYF